MKLPTGTLKKDDKLKYRERVYEIVRRIPRGRVMTYGQIAELLGEGYTPRTVGFAMHDSDDATPWHRVVNAQGACSTGRIVLPHDKQQRLLETEGVRFDKTGRCDLKTFLWISDEQATPNSESPPRVSLFKRNASPKEE
jgi:methylated-DNA-protein-cysteine methyltransferase related protein